MPTGSLRGLFFWTGFRSTSRPGLFSL